MDDAAKGISGAVPTERTVAVGTWNMDHWRRTSQQRRHAWDYLRGASKADVMLLQESVPAPDMSRAHFVHRELAGTRPWGSAVVAFSDGAEIREIDTVRTRYASRRFSMLGSQPGAVIVAEVSLPGIGPITCVSVYGVINVYSQTTMFRVVADLIPLFDSSYGERVVIGGDFNVSTSMRPDVAEFPRYAAVLNAVESLGVVNLANLDIDRPASIQGCRCAEANCRHLHTYGGNPGTQLDWLYATPELARRCTRLRLDHGVFHKLSDHAPIIAEFRLPPPLGRRVVDPESFIAELGACNGTETARVAEDLVEWAERKHQEMERNGRRFGAFDRLPTASGETSELWFQLDVKHEQGLQYTFSVRTDGQLAVQFQHMSTPFDSLEARERLWSKLIQIDGVSLDKRLNGRPTFPLASLVPSDRLEQFVLIFSEMVDETLRVRIGGHSSP